MSELGNIIGEQFEHPAGPNCHICKDVERAAAAVEAMGYRKPRTIITAEELDALPVGAILLDRDGADHRKYRGGWRVTITDLPATLIHEPTP